MSAKIASRLLEHYSSAARALPWRAPPGAAPMEPYRVWLSEIMLQQTTVATVTPRFARFIARWPSVEALAAADEAEVLHEWAGLGYYARARNLIACAKAVVGIGGFPQTEEELRKLPGVGRYTAAAIAAIAFGQRAVVVDTNVERVLARLFAVAQSVPDAKAELRRLAERITPTAKPGDFAQAMMDLGATICRPRAPRCSECPLRQLCTGHATGTPERFPLSKQKIARPHRFGVALWTELEGALWLVRRPAQGLLGGMAALPGPAWGDEQLQGPALASIVHSFTHFTLDLSVVPSGDPQGDGWWQSLDSIGDAGLPTLYRRAVETVLAQRSDVLAT